MHLYILLGYFVPVYLVSLIMYTHVLNASIHLLNSSLLLIIMIYLIISYGYLIIIWSNDSQFISCEKFNFLNFI